MTPVLSTYLSCHPQKSHTTYVTGAAAGIERRGTRQQEQIMSLKSQIPRAEIEDYFSGK
jgi:hypothetical protein